MNINNQIPVVEKKTFEDVINYAQKMNVIMPKSQIEFMKKGLESKKVSTDYLIKIIDKVASKNNEKGLEWFPNSKRNLDTEQEQGRIVAKLQDKNGLVHAYVKEMVVKQHQDPAKIGQKFYTANRIIHGAGDKPGTDLHSPMTTNYDLDNIKHQISCYYSKISFTEIQNDLNANKQKDLKNDLVSTNSPSLTMSIWTFYLPILFNICTFEYIMGFLFDFEHL